MMNLKKIDRIERIRISTMLKRYWFILLPSILFCLGVGGYFAWRAWNGYIFPVHYVKYFDNGGISVEGYRIRTRIDEWVPCGKYIWYYQNGNKRLEGSYDNRSCEVGNWISYDEDGTIKEIEEHHSLKEGIPSRIIHYENGVPSSVDELGFPSGISWSPGGIPVDDTLEGKANSKLHFEMEKAYQAKIKSGATHEEAFKAVYKEFDPKWLPRPEKESETTKGVYN